MQSETEIIDKEIDIIMESNVPNIDKNNDNNDNTSIDNENTKTVKRKMDDESKFEMNITEKLSDIKIENKKTDKSCINNQCKRKNKNFTKATNFTLHYFNIKNKNNKVYLICEDCSYETIKSYGKLHTALQNEQPLYLEEFPNHAELVEISDSSDDENNEMDNDEPMTEDDINFIETCFNDVLEKHIADNSLLLQINWGHQIVKHKIQNNQDVSTKIDKTLTNLQKLSDTICYNLHNTNPSNTIKQLPEIECETKQEVNVSSLFNTFEQDEKSISNPHDVEVIDDDYFGKEIKINSVYYGAKMHILNSWSLCTVIGIVKSEQMTRYKIMFNSNKNFVRLAQANQLAYAYVSKQIFPIGTRIIAPLNISKFVVKDTNRLGYLPGIIAETPHSYNKKRYLIFFDNGYPEYVNVNLVKLVCQSSKNVWDEIEGSSRAFIKDYLTHLDSNRPMVQIKVGMRIIVEWNCQWLHARVINVDASLVQIAYDNVTRIEWMYRGSKRLKILYQAKQQSAYTKTSTQLQKRNEPYIEYLNINLDTSNNEMEKEVVRAADIHVESTKPRRAVAKKTTRNTIKEINEQSYTTKINKQDDRSMQKQYQGTSQQSELLKELNKTNSIGGNTTNASAPRNLNNSVIFLDDTDLKKGKLIYYSIKAHLPFIKYKSHQCNPKCLHRCDNKLSSYTALSRPFLCGWQRQFVQKKQTNTTKCIMYRAPCGRRLRNIQEIHKYLRMTNCPLNVECFNFDWTLNCLAEYNIDKYIVKDNDISNGLEGLPIECINYFDDEIPVKYTYAVKRLPTEGVNLNLDPEFLAGCDCTDDCSDKQKCSCWKLTIEGAKSVNKNINPNKIGYDYKRLMEPCQTGIYECNQNCRCKKNCLNRVVQEPLQVKLQVFKTANRGWGLRCLTDIPKGCYICCYAGHLLTEHAANASGCDEYFAELDYIEVVESMKEAYESDVKYSPADVEYFKQFNMQLNVDKKEIESIKEEENNSKDESDDDNVNTVDKSGDSDEEFQPHHSFKPDYATRPMTRMKNRLKSISESNKSPDNNGVTSIISKTDNNNKSMLANTAAAAGTSNPDVFPDTNVDFITISDDEDESTEVRQPISFMPNVEFDNDDYPTHKSVRKLFGEDEYCYVMDAKSSGNVGRYFNHSCSPNLFVQNVFVDTHDLRFPWVAFFALHYIRAGTELTWNYCYDVGSVPGKVLYCQCGSKNCRGRLL